MSESSGSILPSADVLNEFQYGKYVLSNLAAKRAKQLKEGAPPLVRVDSKHPLTIALAEIAAGKIRPILGKEEVELAIVEPTLTMLSDAPSDLGILLPALDEGEAELIGVAALADHDLDHEDEIESDAVVAPSLSDLLGDAEVEEPVAPEGDGDTLSLSDIEEQENVEAEEEVEQ